MVIQEKSCVPETETVLSSGTSMLLDVGAQSGVGEGHVPKIRKPYTITKQRERWTEEEHKKFLEALKLHGRAWRKIEEHVGSKTAVQIRSHAQKFFSKVVRETNNSNASSTEPIEIPPPRPKRNPAHPYPRKLVLPSKKDSPMEQSARSASPNSSLSDQGNQSPTSVLSAVDTLRSADSMTPNGSPSPIFPADVIDQTGLLATEDNGSVDDEHVPQSPSTDRFSVKLELFPSIDAYDKPESPSNKVLKLFGKDVVIQTKPCELSASLSKSPSLDMGEGVLQASRENSQPVDITMGSGGNVWDSRTYYDEDGNGNQVEKPTPLPWWVFFRGTVAPLCENAQEKESPREDSCAGSSSELVNADNNSDSETQSSRNGPQSVKQSNCSEEPVSEAKPSFLEKRKSMDSGSKGFVLYKRCFSERDMQSSIIASDEKDGPRTRLCL